MEAKKIIVKTWTTVSGLRTAQADRGRHEADQKKTRGMRFPVGPNFLINDKPTWLRFELMQYLAFPAAKFMYAVAFMCRVSE
ncbi:hypothetical protein T4B_6506 [Trichinella pseudospiralis]|uniref:Uncharacterized protein n=1 Tax=Trichinella pseudospiralis TaxID=6337 RepID=A0A0V1GK89_TRIPS|nr:hypothetical protein T4B_6506 [Trichinella pseudospiralis]